MKFECVGMGSLTTDELLQVASLADEDIYMRRALIKDIYTEIDARIEIVEGMSLAGTAGLAGELITEKWLWADWQPEEEEAK